MSGEPKVVFRKLSYNTATKKTGFVFYESKARAEAKGAPGTTTTSYTRTDLYEAALAQRDRERARPAKPQYTAIKGKIHHREHDGEQWEPVSNELAKRIVSEWQQAQEKK